MELNVMYVQFSQRRMEGPVFIDTRGLPSRSDNRDQ